MAVSTKELSARTDTREIVGRYVDLKPSAKSHVGLCPFHDDHNPSLSVQADRWKCFACDIVRTAERN